MLGDDKGAISDLRKAVRLKPSWVQARNILGLAEMRAGRLTSAERHFRAAVRVGPLNSSAALNLVGLLARARRWNDVLSSIERYWKPGLAPVPLSRFAAEACLELENPRGSRDWLEAALEKAEAGNERAAVLNNLGVAYTELDLPAEALKAFRRSLDEAASPTTAANLGIVLLESGETGQSVDWLRGRWKRPDFRSREVGMALATALMFAVRHEEAIQVAKELAERADADDRVLGVLSGLLADGTQDYLAAIRYASSGLERWPESVMLKNNLSYALLMAGRHEEAARTLATIDDSTLDRRQRVCVTATRGLLRLWQGDLTEGRRLYAAALESAGREALRERVKAKRDLECARALGRLAGPVPEAIALLRRASEARAGAEPYASHARAEMRRLTAGPASQGGQRAEEP